MTATPNFASDAHARPEAGEQPTAATSPFVLNLCSSTTPMALAQTELPELKRFNFFVSRRFEEGRERFRLHMGYFATLAEAGEWARGRAGVLPGRWGGGPPGPKPAGASGPPNRPPAPPPRGPPSRGGPRPGARRAPGAPPRPADQRARGARR